MNVYLTKDEYLDIATFIKNKLYEQCEFSCLENLCERAYPEDIPCMELDHLKCIGKELINVEEIEYDSKTKNELLSLKCSFSPLSVNYAHTNYLSTNSSIKNHSLYEIFLMYCSFIEVQYMHNTDMKQKLIIQFKEFLLFETTYTNVHILLHDKVKVIDTTKSYNGIKSDLANIFNQCANKLSIGNNPSDYIDFIKVVSYILNSITIDNHESFSTNSSNQLFCIIYQYLRNDWYKNNPQNKT